VGLTGARPRARRSNPASISPYGGSRSPSVDSPMTKRREERPKESGGAAAHSRASLGKRDRSPFKF